MEDKPVVVREDGGGAAIFGSAGILVGAIIVALLVGLGLYMWHPWTTTNTTTTNTVTQPADNNGSTSKSSTTTTSNATP
jgi:hypothetical protein